MYLIIKNVLIND